MIETLRAAGWPIWPLLLASLIALTIIVERAWSLRRGKVMPRDLLAQVAREVAQEGPTPALLRHLSHASMLARLFALSLSNVGGSSRAVKESLGEAQRLARRDLERFLPTLGTIASLAPIMGLFGTVVGMIEIFGAQGGSGMSSNPQQLAHGISVALYNTAFGLIVAIPSMISYRYYRAKAESLAMEIEAQALKLVETVNVRENSGDDPTPA